MAVSTYRPFNLDDSDEEFKDEEGDNGPLGLTGRSALLMIIDATPSMFGRWDEDEEKGTPFLAAIKCCEAILRSKIVSNPTDLVGILLYGTEETKDSNFPNIFELQELSTLKVDMIKELIDMRNDPEGLNGFEEKIGSSKDYCLKDLFWQAKMCFDKAKSQQYAKKIMLFTCEDDPHSGNSNLQADAVSKFKDLGGVDLSLTVFREHFDHAKFYKNLVEDESSLICAKNVEDLMKIVRMKQRLRRPISRAFLEFLPGLKVGIGYYSFVRRAAKPRHVNINKRNNEKLERTVNSFRSDTGMPVLKSEERKVVSVQGERAVFTDQELKQMQMQTPQETGIKIVGFLRSENFDNFIWYRSDPYFIYPDEERVSGSKELFTTFLKRCQLLDRVPVVRYILTRGKTPKLGVLIPSAPDEDSKFSKLFPQGFHLFPIPFKDEVRKHEIDPIPDAPKELVDLMEKVVKRLTNSGFDVLEVKNPSLQSLWRKLEEEALEERVDDPTETFDFTEPNVELMKDRLKSIPNKIEELVEAKSKSFCKMKSSTPVYKKRKIDIEMEARHGRLKNCTCVQLREFLRERDVFVPMICGKDNLINMVNKSLM